MDKKNLFFEYLCFLNTKKIEFILQCKKLEI
jgi:hypothetical protein